MIPMPLPVGSSLDDLVTFMPDATVVIGAILVVQILLHPGYLCLLKIDP